MIKFNVLNRYTGKIQFPARAKRLTAIGSRKCRASYVTTLKIYDCDNKFVKDSVSGKHDPKTKYKAGNVTVADKFDDDVRVECSNGIHFFMTRKEAERW